MSAKLDGTDLRKVSAHLLTNGPHKTLPAERRVRIIFNKHVIVDTASPMFVWEHAFYPYYYIPKPDASSPLIKWREIEKVGIKDLVAMIWEISVDEKKSDRVIEFMNGPLGGLVRFESKAMDQWLEEDQPIAIHPKDPYKRVDCLPSTRPIKVSLGDTVLASSPYSVHLHETGLPVRFYIPLGHTNVELLEKSETTTGCPYKGTANYYSVKLPGEKGEVVKDVVWYYEHPTLECAAITGFLCFYNEKVDIELDGKKLERPKTHFA